MATNVSTMSVAYFHHKTTPDVPIIIAIRSSGALPGLDIVFCSYLVLIFQ